MWNIKSSNRILDMLQKQQAHNRHIKALKNIRSTLNNSKPKKYIFLDFKAKANQYNKQRNKQIQYRNSVLVGRMVTVPSCLEGLKEVFVKDSLNSGAVRKMERRIDRENQKFVRKLKSTNSQYSQKAMSKSMRAYQRVKTSIIYSKMDQYYDFEKIPRKPFIEDNVENRSQFAKVRPESANK